ncbi:uncharacterized protein [Eleutherodactylus coqui]|uniref:uncharacterized protein n=1 Tax=Eleutherodactylus coqui TaxID=57060 RepID=UPI003462E93B
MVYHLGEGQDSTSWLNNNKGDLGKMFLSHLENVVDFLHTEFPEKKLLMWDDMLRKLSRESIQGDLNEDAKKDISHILGFSSINPEKNTCDGTGGFPGSEIYNMVKKVHSELKGKVHEITEGDSDRLQTPCRSSTFLVTQSARKMLYKVITKLYVAQNRTNGNFRLPHKNRTVTQLHRWRNTVMGLKRWGQSCSYFLKTWKCGIAVFILIHKIKLTSFFSVLLTS